jgi:membrane protease YdiL (CAAX protease family)
MLQKNGYVWVELLTLFFVLPILLGFPIPTIAKVSLVIIGLLYIIFIALKLKLIPSSSLLAINSKVQWEIFFIRFLAIGTTTTLIMVFVAPENLFIVVKEKPLMWIGIIVFYCIFSVYPQELLYRSFFFNRYKNIVKSENSLLLLNILAFPLAHLLFNNFLVLPVTLIGGALFAITYQKSKSVMLTSIEHAVYGCWIYTLGMGEMLAFPMPY